MKLIFADYDEIQKDSTFTDDYDEIQKTSTFTDEELGVVRSMVCKKLSAINRNPNLTKELFEEHLHLEMDETSVYLIDNKKEIDIRFKFNLFELFDCSIEIIFHVYYDKNGKQLNYTSMFNEDTREDTTLHKYLNINHFKQDNECLRFHLQKNYHGESYNIYRRNILKPILSQRKIVSGMYHFDIKHQIIKKTIEIKDFFKSGMTSFSLEGLGDVETELMFIEFLNHVITVKSDVDSSFLNYEKVNFDSAYWIKVVHKDFKENLKSDKKSAFLDYMKLVEMIKF